jgi:hypothetical protein
MTPDAVVVHDFLREHPLLRDTLLSHDLFDAENIQRLGFAAGGRDPIHRSLLALQRVHRVVGDVDIALTLLGLGFRSAAQIASTPLDRFRALAGEAFGGSAPQAAAAHTAAVSRRDRVVQQFFNLRESTAPHYRAMPFANLHTAAAAAFGTLPDYDSLFGSPSYFTVPDARAVFSPAAYFVDLLRAVTHHVDASANTARSLSTRRPDLTAIQLDDDNTNRLVPALDIVVALLENVNPGKAPEAGAQITRLLEQSAWNPPAAVYESLASAHFPFVLPFNLALKTQQAALALVGTSRAALLETFVVTPDCAQTIARDRLGLSVEQSDIMTTPVENPDVLQAYWGVTNLKAGLQDLDSVPVFLDKTGLAMPELAALLVQGCSEEEVAATVPSGFFINRVKGQAKGAFVATTSAGTLTLTQEHLDTTHRFIRLARALGWSFADLEWVLASTCGGVIDEEAIRKIAAIEPWRAAYGVPLDVLCSVWSDMKVTGTGPDPLPADLFDRTFNPKATRAATWAAGPVRVYRPANSWNPLFTDAVQTWNLSDPDDQTPYWRDWLRAALGIGADELMAIARYVQPPPVDHTKGWAILLDLTALSRFFAVATMARLFRLSIDDGLWLLGHLGLERLASPDHFAVIEAAAAWLRRSRLTPGDLRFLVDGTHSTGTPRRITDQQMIRFLRMLASPQPPAVGTPEDLFQKHAADFWGVPSWLIAAVTGQVARDAGINSVLDAFLDAATRLQTTGLDDAARAIFDAHERYITLAKRLRLTQAEATALFVEKSLLCAQNDITLPALTIGALRSLFEYKALASRYRDVNNGLLAGLVADPVPAPAALSTQFAGVTGWDPVDLLALITFFQKQSADWKPDTIDGLSRLSRAFDLAARLDTGAAAAALWSTDVLGAAASKATPLARDTPFAAAATAALLAFHKGDRDKTDRALRAAVSRPRRDALIGAALEHLKGTIADAPLDARGLSEYLLTDIQVSDVVQTSLLEQATNAVQLYLYRIRMNLEPGIALTAGDQANGGTDTIGDTTAWWAWMQNYRVWEANREVFLYPENYAVPQARHVKSDLFAAFEAALNQGSLTEAAVEDALQGFIEGFAELASLRTAGCCLHDDPLTGARVLTLIGVTATTPCQLFYRTATFPLDIHTSRYGAGVWAPWTAIDLRIPGSPPDVKPVFAFGRLFVFWHETTTRQQTTDKTGKLTGTVVTETYASISYSFFGPSGRWVSAQVLTADIDVTTDTAFRWDARLVPRAGDVPESIVVLWGDTLAAGSQIDNTLNVSPFATVGSDPTQPENPPDNRVMMLDNGLLSLAPLPVEVFYPFESDVTEVISGASAAVLGTPVTFSGPGPNGMLTALHIPDQRTYLQLPGPFSGNAPHVVAFWISPLPTVMDSGGMGLLGPMTSAGLTASYIYLQTNNLGWYLAVETYFLGNSISFSLATFPLEQHPSDWFFAVIQISQALDVSLWINGQTITGSKTTPQDQLPSDVSTTTNPQVGSTNAYCGGLARLAFLNFDNATQPQIDWLNRTQLLGIALTMVPSKATLTPIAGNGDWALFEFGTDQYLARVTGQDRALVEFSRLTSSAGRALERALLVGGVDGLLSLDTQQRPCETAFDAYRPLGPATLMPTPPDTVDFNGPNGIYFWEIFFHAPRLIASLHNANQNFDAARAMLARVFDPTASTAGGTSDPWRFVPLRATDSETLLTMLTNPTALAAYRNDPFDPHAIAQLRPVAYQKAVVMDYIGNLLDWGDALFRKYTRESLNEAVMLYMMAADLLGRRPDNRGPYPLPVVTDADGLATLGYTEEDFLVRLENHQVNAAAALAVADPPANYLADVTVYFGIPENDQFVAVFDRVDDRLDKIRHGLNIDGVAEPLPLFDPPLDPLALVEALANGEGLEAAVASQGLGPVAVPNYRFGVLVQKAKELTSHVVDLGRALLDALEKTDAAQLERLRTTQEGNIEQLLLAMKYNQVDSAIKNLATLQASLDSAQMRTGFYSNALANALTPYEQTQIDALTEATDLTITTIALHSVAAVAALMPQAGDPLVLTWGGEQLSHFSSNGAMAMGAVAERASYQSNLAAAQAGFDRRADEWRLQLALANADLDMINAQIAVATVAQAMAVQDYAMLQRQIANTQQVDDFLTTRFTSQELYQWMVTRLAGVYFQAYQLALVAAQQCETAYQFERGSQLRFVSSDYWDDLHKGLLAGNALLLDLQRMEKAFLDNDGPRFEIQKVFSLKQLAPDQLTALKSGGTCKISLTARLFEADFPGHIRRQIKTVTVALPALVGPTQNVSVTLTQLTNRVVLQPVNAALDYLLDNTGSPAADVLRQDWRPNGQVALSRAAGDAGVFEINFGSERYLPFEGTGAISEWQLDVANSPAGLLDAMTDVILTLQYTAVAGTPDYKSYVLTKVPAPALPKH